MATAPATSTQPGFLDSIRNALDQIDNEVDQLKNFPFIGSLATSVAAILDPIRKEVDALDPQAPSK